MTTPVKYIIVLTDATHLPTDQWPASRGFFHSNLVPSSQTRAMQCYLNNPMFGVFEKGSFIVVNQIEPIRELNLRCLLHDFRGKYDPNLLGYNPGAAIDYKQVKVYQLIDGNLEEVPYSIGEGFDPTFFHAEDPQLNALRYLMYEVGEPVDVAERGEMFIGEISVELRVEAVRATNDQEAMKLFGSGNGTLLGSNIWRTATVILPTKEWTANDLKAIGLPDLLTEWDE